MTVFGDIPGDRDRPYEFARSAGKQNITAEEGRTSESYGYLSTADKVTGIVLPTDGLICVAYQALFKSSPSGGFGLAAIFLGSDEVLVRNNWGSTNPGSGGVLGETGDANEYVALASFAGGLTSNRSTGASVNNGSDATTGQVVGVHQSRADGGGDAVTTFYGGPCYIFAAAGTYDVGVQFRATNAGQTVTAKERKLWVWSMAFA